MLYQVNKNLFRRHFIQSIRYIHRDQTAKTLYPLECRKLLRVGGQDAGVFLQGLITNDIRHLDEGTNSMYAMFLNNKGRVLYDTLIYKWDKDDSYMIECDKNIIGVLQKYLKMFKLKRIVDIVDASEEFKLYAFISNTESDAKIESKTNLFIYKDPRIVDLGFRVISSVSLKEVEIAEVLGKDVKVNNDGEDYKYLRYKLGVSEGAEDLPPGSSFPLEANCDYLHGVSFHKGCYIGQEVTARVHHTGVVRKRIMPLKFIEEVDKNIEKDSVISAISNPKSNLGKLRGSARDYGLGLVRIKEAMDAKILTIGNYCAEIVKPTWWPHEAPKDKATVIKAE